MKCNTAILASPINPVNAVNVKRRYPFHIFNFASKQALPSYERYGFQKESLLLLNEFAHLFPRFAAPWHKLIYSRRSSRRKR